MKNWISLFFLIILMSCHQQQDSLIGKWGISNPFYSASYQIIEEDNELNGLVLFYDDGTTRYKHDGSERHYAFTGLKKDQELYVDGISGATTKNTVSKSIEIQKINKDSLEVTTFIMNKPVTEIWVRK